MKNLLPTNGKNNKITVNSLVYTADAVNWKDA
jgi:hypothetical protein